MITFSVNRLSQVTGKPKDELQVIMSRAPGWQQALNQADPITRAVAAQWFQQEDRRAEFNAQEGHLASRAIAANDGRIPADVWRLMDTQTSTLMRQPNLTLLEDLIGGYSKPVNIGKIKVDYRIASGAGNTKTSISGNVEVLTDKTAYTYDGNIVPVHTAGYGRQWREMEGQRSEGFDGLIDDDANTARTLADKLSDYVYNGDATVAFDGAVGYGVKNHPNTVQADLGAGGYNINFATSTDGAAILSKFRSVRDALRITKAVSAGITVYVSRAIYSNWEQLINTANGSNVYVLDLIKRLAGIVDVKEDASLVGNQMLLIALDRRHIQLLVGQATMTYALPRQTMFANYDFVKANATGLEIRKDANGNSGVLYAAG